MKVLLVTNLFPSAIDPERGVFTLQLAKQLAKHSELTVVCPLPWFPKWRVFRALKKWYLLSQVPFQYQIQGVTVYSPKYPMLPKVSEAMQAKLMIFGLKRCVSKLHKQRQFDVVNSHWLYPDSVAVDSISQSLAIPHIATGLGCDVNHDIFDQKKRQPILEMVAKTKAITVVSSDLKRVLIEQGATSDKIYTLANGVDTNQFKQLDKGKSRTSLGLKSTQNIILYVGRLSEEKNIAALIKAFARLDKIQQQELYIIGDGPLKNTLESLSKTLGISQLVHFIGAVEHSMVSIWMASCDLFCLPSIREGCPNVVLEALGSGRPVIASNVGGIPDMVNSSTGILFDPLNIDSIKDSLHKASTVKWNEKRISDSVKARTWENVALQYLDVYERALL